VKQIEFSRDQEDALSAVIKWFETDSRHRKPYFALAGFAGTGKSTILAYLVDTMPGVAAAALCGKAAHNLRCKGIDAKTIHSLIYIPFQDASGSVRFQRRPCLGGIELIVIDEASMIDHVVLCDLLAFRIPVLFVGDHGQLQPIGTDPGLMANPDFRLEKIHRQALGNPILRLATAFREGSETPRYQSPDGRLKMLPALGFWENLNSNVQAICGFHKTRHRANKRIREQMGISHKLLSPGEKLLCLKNNKACGVFNGQQMTVQSVGRERRGVIKVEVLTDDDRITLIPCFVDQFGKDLITHFNHKTAVLMDYGYALTCHKAQGSEFEEVLVLEELASGWDPRRWRYTAATRARDRLIYCSGPSISCDEPLPF
jgi:ATP-dependent exoDNAse (exonuclease V) alpha subunit